MKNEQFLNPTREQYEEYLIQVSFGSGHDYLVNCVKSAYRDVCRTLRGLKDIPKREELTEKAKSEVISSFRQVAQNSSINNQESFDSWHNTVCQTLLQIYSDASFTTHYGQAQKWINMTFKNIFTCGQERVPGFTHLYQYCHVPIDNYVLNELKRRKMKIPSERWSQWDYDTYMGVQEAIRNLFGNQIPLNVEFRLWLVGRANQNPRK